MATWQTSLPFMHLVKNCVFSAGPRNCNIIWHMALRTTSFDVLPWHPAICAFERRVLRNIVAINIAKVSTLTSNTNNLTNNF